MERTLGPIIPGGWVAAPSPLGLENPGSGQFISEVTRRRVQQWFKLRRKIHRHLRGQRALGPSRLEEDLNQAENLARAALRSAVEAYHWLADAKLDLEPGCAVVLDGRQLGEMELLVERAHVLTHHVGDVVGGLFGCRILHENDVWYNECQTSLLHIPYGNSMSITARHRCSICDRDFGDCEHRRGERYEVVVSRAEDDSCSACGSSTCDHTPGTTVKVPATTRMDDIVLHEVSLTPRPRDPLARITGREVDPAKLVSILGRMPSPEEEVLDHTCMAQCEGFRSPWVPTEQSSELTPVPGSTTLVSKAIAD